MSYSEHESRVITLEGGINFRDLGGYEAADGRRTRWLQVFRSGTTHRLTARDRERLGALGIRSIVDLRSSVERHEQPHGLHGHEGVVYLAHDHEHGGGNLLKMLADPGLDAENLRQAMIKVYRQLPYELASSYRLLFRQIATGPLPLAFNCVAGKDRTGVAAALLLTALGVCWEDVMTDYLLTQECVADIERNFTWPREYEMPPRVTPAVIAPLFGVDEAYLEAMREAVIRRSGSIENYFLLDLKLDADLIEKLRRRLLS